MLMNQKPDPKELKVLSDILALVLEDQPGQSMNALEAIKKRAKKNAITGGALKNLFNAIAPNPPKPTVSRAKSQLIDGNEILKARARISQLTQSINQLDTDLRNARKQNEALRAELILTQQARSEMQSALYLAETKTPFRTIITLVSFTCGLLIGIAGTVLVHSLNATPKVDNSLFLR